MAFLVYLIFRLFKAIITALPLDANFRLGRAFGTAAYYFLPPYRKLVVSNLSIAFPEKGGREIRRMARQHFSTLGANLLCSVKMPSMPPDEIGRHVRVENFDRIRAGLGRKRGVVLFISHIGNWELFAQFGHLTPGERTSTIYQPLGNAYIDAIIKKDRNRQGIIPFDRKDGFNVPIKFLREGGLVGVLVDQHAGDGGVWTPLFNRLASTSPLAATLAIRTGAEIVPAAIYTTGLAQWRFATGEPFHAGSLSPEALTAKINRVLEDQIRVSPPDWFWVHDRWKTPSPNFLLSKYKRGISFPPGFDPKTLTPFRILIRSTNWLGDAVMSVPAVEAVKHGRPDARLSILTPAKLADFWSRVDAVDEIIRIEPGETPFSVARKISNKFDVAILFPNSLRSAMEAFLAGIPRRAGYAGRHRRLLLNELVPSGKTRRKKKSASTPAHAEHQVYHYLRLAEHFGARAMPDLPPPGTTGDPPAIDSPARKRAATETEALRAFFAGTSHQPQPPQAGPVKIGLCPGAEYGPAKRWPAAQFAAAARLVSRRIPCEWIIYGAAADAPAAAEIDTALEGRCTNLAGKTSLAELIDSMQQCSVLLTNDTGTMHLASFLRIPTVAIFGSTEPALTGPLGSRHRIIRHQVECSPCFLRECPIDFRCMKAVKPEEVADAVIQCLKQEKENK